MEKVKSVIAWVKRFFKVLFQAPEFTALVKLNEDQLKLKDEILEELRKTQSLAINLTARVKMHQQVLCALITRHGYGGDIITLDWDEIAAHEKNETLVSREGDKVRLKLDRPEDRMRRLVRVAKTKPKTKQQHYEDASS